MFLHREPTTRLEFSDSNGGFTFTIPGFDVVIERETCWPPDLEVSGVCEEEHGYSDIHRYEYRWPNDRRCNLHADR